MKNARALPTHRLNFFASLYATTFCFVGYLLNKLRDTSVEKAEATFSCECQANIYDLIAYE